MEILIATQNAGKVQEYRDLLKDIDVTLVGLADIGLESLDVEENGTTFEENALIKAKAYAIASKMIALADDSGLCVDALDGRPGLYSARYGGAGLDDAGRRQKLLSELETVPTDKRTARFECVIAVVNPATDKVISASGTCPGHIASAESDGDGGFGYDPIFIPAGHAKTFADFPESQKNVMSHRGIATQNIVPKLVLLNG